MEGRSYCSIGNCLRALVQLEKANECYIRVSHKTDIGMHSMASSASYVGTTTSVQGLAIAGELEDQLGEGVIHHNMGMTYEMLANLDQTQEHFEKV